MKQIKFGFAQPEATNHVFVCTNCETPLITHNYGVDYGQLLMEQERENEEWADAFNCCLVSRKTAMPAMPIERRQAHSEDWKQAKLNSLTVFKTLLSELLEDKQC